jgi:mannosyltransferase
LSFFPIHFYIPDLPETFLADESGSPNDTLAPATQKALSLYPVKDINEAVGDAKEVYFVVFLETIQEYQDNGQKHPNITWLEKHFLRNDQTAFNDLLVYHFSQLNP